MGESTQAGNKGIPSTPRDGSPVEIVGLAHSVASWLSDLAIAKKIDRLGFRVKNEYWTWDQWASKIKNNFDSKFWTVGGYYKGSTLPYIAVIYYGP